MDRIASTRKIWVFLAALSALLALPARAGTVLAPPPPAEKPQPGESYPESRFGQPPAKPDLGVGQSYAAKAVEDMEAPDEGQGDGASRAPAGLVFRNTSAPIKPNAAEGMAEPQATPESSAMLRKGVQEVALIAGDLGYFPKTLFVSRDVPVRLFVTGASKSTLCIMMDSFQVRKQVRSQKIEEITFTPNVPGKYRFYCPVNGMEGTLIVKELASNIEGK